MKISVKSSFRGYFEIPSVVRSASLWLIAGVALLAPQNLDAKVGDEFTDKDLGLTFVVLEEGGVNTVEVKGCTTAADSFSGEVVIPQTVQYAGLEYTVTSIGDYSFQHYTGLTSIKLPETITYIGRWSLGGCTQLTSIDLPESVTTFDTNAFNSTGLTSVHIPANVAHLPSSIFRKCASLTSVTFAEDSKLAKISAYCFGETGLTELTLPASVNEILSGMFEKSTVIKTVTFNSPVPPFKNVDPKNIFIQSSMLDGGTFYVPEESLKLYQEALSGLTNATILPIPEPIFPELMISQTSLELKAGESAHLTLTAMPESLTATARVWKSSDEDVATVSADGDVLAVAPGEATITVWLEGYEDYEASCVVTVSASQEQKHTEIIVRIPGHCDLSALCDPEKTYRFKVTPADGKTVQTVSCEGVALDPDEDGVFAVDASEPLTIHVALADDVNTDIAVAERDMLTITSDRYGFTVSGLPEHTPLTVYDTQGRMLGSAVSRDGTSSMNLAPGHYLIRVLHNTYHVII